MASLALFAVFAGQTEIPLGAGSTTVDLDGARIELFTYKPEGYRDGPLLLVFHGVLRNADEYRDHATGMAKRFKALVVAPRFPEDRFPLEVYQFGGVSVKGEVKPRKEWSGSLVPQIVRQVRSREKRPDMPYYLIGHSGGGQFLIRFAGFTPNEAKRIVVSNAGTYLFPSKQEPYPFGFGGLPEDIGSDDALRQFLAQPVTLYLAMDDTERDEYLDRTPPAERQGLTRWDRGRNTFRAAQRLARERNWKFGWKVVSVKGVGHDHEKMFDHALCEEALFGARAEGD